MSIRRPMVVAFILSILSLSSSAGLGYVRSDSSRAASEVVGQRLTDAQWMLVRGVLDVEAELKKVAGSGSGADSVLKLYRMQFNKQLARARVLGRGQRPVLSSRDRESIATFLEQVDQVHLTALRLSSNFASRGESLAPSGTSSCYGSIAGTVQGPSGPLDGILVAAHTAEGITAGSALTLGDGSYQIDDLLAGEDYYLVTSNADALIDEVFDDVECLGGSCDPVIGSPVGVSAGVTTAGYDFVLAAGGRIGGALTGEYLSVPLSLPFTTVNVFDATGELVTSAVSDLDGAYLTETGLPAGSYYVVTADILFGNLDELYNDIPCPAGAGCDPTTGTEVVVTVPNVSTGIDFDLAEGGHITGNITDSNTLLPIGNILVGIHDASGLLIAFGASDATGNYSILQGLPTGSFFAATGNLAGYVDELYDNIPCTVGLCGITTGTTIEVTLGATTANIDFALSPGGTFSGRVTKTMDGAPLADVFILGHTDTGDLVGTATTDANGDYILMNGLGSGSYRATTLNPLGFHDELFDNLPCPDSVCDVTVGAPIAVTIGLDTPNIDFDLTGDAIISCSFEGCSTCGFGVVP